jgi:acetyl esterase
VRLFPLSGAIAPPVPQHILDEMARVGPTWGENVTLNVKRMVELYSEVLASCPKSGVVKSSDVRYGPHARNVLDIYRADYGTAARKKKPALLFLHGGAFVEGDRNKSEEVYSNVLYYFARHGIIGLNVEYRLAPEAQYPEGSIDVGLAVEWVHDHADELGVDKHSIFLMGHSAGAAHAAGYAYDTRMHSSPGKGIAGLVIVSGRVRADNSIINPNAKKVQSYYGDVPHLYDQRSPVSFVNSDSVPTMVAVAEYENPLIDVYCAELTYRLSLAKGRLCPFIWLPKHNHTSIIAHFNTAEDFLPASILHFIENTTLR